MRAAYITRYAADALQLGELPHPSMDTLDTGHVLIRVHYVAINPVDVKTRRGSIKAIRGTPSVKHPLVLGYDCSGEVVGLGLGIPADTWRIGDQVRCSRRC